MFQFVDFQPFSYTGEFIYFKKENKITKKSVIYMQFCNQLFKMNIIINIDLYNLNLSVTFIKNFYCENFNINKKVEKIVQ